MGNKHFAEECAKLYLDETYEPQISQLCNKVSLARWAYVTNLTNDQAAEDSLRANLELAEFQFKQWDQVIRWINDSDFTDDVLKRQLKFLNKVGVAALETSELEQVRQKFNYFQICNNYYYLRDLLFVVQSSIVTNGKYLRDCKNLSICQPRL